MTEGPKRLSESEGGELGESLGLLKQQLPGPERLTRIADRLAQAGIVVPPAPPAPGPPLSEQYAPPRTAPLPSSNGGLIAKAALGVVGAGGTVLLLVMATGTPQEPPSTRARPAETIAPSTSAPQAPSSVVEPRAGDGPRAPGSRSVRIPIDAQSTPSLQSAPGTLPIPGASAPSAVERSWEETPPPVETRERAKAQAAARSSNAPVETDTRREAPTAPGESSVVARPEPPAAPPSSEVELLKAARAAVASDPQRALTLTRRHRGEFPYGAYAQERDFIAISALTRLNRPAEARQQAEVFRRRYPRSPYLPQLARLLGEP